MFIKNSIKTIKVSHERKKLEQFHKEERSCCLKKVEKLMILFTVGLIKNCIKIS